MTERASPLRVTTDPGWELVDAGDDRVLTVEGREYICLPYLNLLLRRAIGRDDTGKNAGRA